MTHFAMICPAETGHLNPMFAIGRKLQRCGHRVTFIGVLDAQATTLAAGLEFRAIAESEYPLGAMPKLNAQLGELSGLPALRYAFSDFQQWNAVLLRDAPGAIEEAGVEALLVDQVIPVGGTAQKSNAHHHPCRHEYHSRMPHQRGADGGDSLAQEGIFSAQTSRK